ncbi:MAMMALIAN LYST-INTERACTING PROTEIN 5-like protein [Diplonema papillatum]|nr:MAMMALIAN LYST-INTERACTING PROTEIN 5-like protein [Diplonema papillatum]KAJ9469981.1 MAMMALIAN LYST-INTERACTING PROTEIN 5-like protein [Diplonema papillatum]
MDNQALVASCPPCLKTLVPYLTRARDFGTRDPALAYLIKSYAAQVGISSLVKLKGTADEGLAAEYVIKLMDALEGEKKTCGTFAEGEAKQALLKNALLIFKRADDRERTNQGDKSCIAMFTTASVLMECTKQFGEMDPDIVEKHRYARYTATQIKRAIDSGVPYSSPNAPLQTAEDDEALIRELNALPSQPPPAHVDPAPPPTSTQSQPAFNSFDGFDAASNGYLPSAGSAPAAFAAAPPQQPPPAGPPPRMDDLDALMSGLPQPPSSAPYANAGLPQTDSMDTDGIEERLARLSGGAGPNPSTVRVTELESEVVQLKRKLAAAESQVAAAQKQAADYAQVANMLKAQLTAAGGSGGPSFAIPTPGFHPTLDQMTDAQKNAKYVISALQFKDVTTARDNLIKAMRIINGHV